MNRAIVNRESGATLLEYSLLATLITLACLVALPGESIECLLTKAQGEMVGEEIDCEANRGNGGPPDSGGDDDNRITTPGFASPPGGSPHPGDDSNTGNGIGQDNSMGGPLGGG